MDKTYKQLIKDVSALYTITNQDQFDSIKNNFKKSILKAIKNYADFRLKLMQNKNITDVESKAITAAVKAGVKYAVKYYGVSIDDDKIDDVVNQILPEVLGYVQSKRTDLFTDLLKVIDNYESNQRYKNKVF